MKQHEYRQLDISDRRLIVRAMTELIVAEWRRGNFMGAASEAAVEWSEKVLTDPEQGFAVLCEAYCELDSIPFKSPQTAAFCNAWVNGKILQWAHRKQAA